MPRSPTSWLTAATACQQEGAHEARPGGLGRGLDALLSCRAAGGVLELDVAAGIRPNPGSRARASRRTS